MTLLVAFAKATVNADEQFNAPDADLVLRCSDGIHFAVHRAILRLASPVFRDMLSLPQPSVNDSVVSMSEDSQTLRTLLRFIYPRSFCAEPNLSELADIKRAAGLARKYDIQFMRDAAEKALVALADSQPEIAYVVAWKYEYPIALRAAARRYLEPHESSSHDPDYDEVPATAFKRLLEYSDKVPSALEELLTDGRDEEHPITWIRPNYAWWSEQDKPESVGFEEGNAHMCLTEVTWYRGDSAAESHHAAVSSWWWTYVRAVVRLVQSRARPSLEDALRQPLVNTDARQQLAGCESCRLRVEYGLLDWTKQHLRAEIERRLDEIPIDAPFMRSEI
ncbi:unnamed protein product [Peniophora sp. CBMAI 1063]|nr:unnamed protein product [Peniophora sp. CBMAI 1063]